MLQRRQDTGFAEQEEDNTIKLGDTTTISKCSSCTKNFLWFKQSKVPLNEAHIKSCD